MKKVYIAAGGTGGHINAALSVGEALSDDYQISYLSGIRYLDYQLFKNQDCLHLNSKPLRTKNPAKLFVNICYNLLVFFKIVIMYISSRPEFIVGAGGYICGPTLIAGKILGIPVFIIEQNAVVGMTNKILSRFSNLIFTNFENTKGIKKTTKVLNSGNPIRSSIREEENSISEKIKVLIFGGSLGATQINDAIKLLIKKDLSLNLDIIHQVGRNNVDNVETVESNITYKQLEYINDMPSMYKWSNIIIARAGASSISELRVIKRPCLLIPYPNATDNHQYHNAMELKEENGFFVEVLDKSLTGEMLAVKIEESLRDIVQNKKFYQNNITIANAAQFIKKEIIKYVRN